MIPSLYIGNGCLIKHPFRTGWVQSSKNIRRLPFLDFRDVVRKQQNPRFVFFNGKFLIAQSRMFIFHSWDFQFPIQKHFQTTSHSQSRLSRRSFCGFVLQLSVYFCINISKRFQGIFDFSILPVVILRENSLMITMNGFTLVTASPSQNESFV